MSIIFFSYTIANITIQKNNGKTAISAHDTLLHRNNTFGQQVGLIIQVAAYKFENEKAEN